MSGNDVRLPKPKKAAAKKQPSKKTTAKMGANAVDRIRERLQQRLREVDTVEPLGRPTDFE
ncbi:hypothetical protein ABZ876_35400 [Streptomyces sp. NPDC046931]|uniref:hypothetical protein n=1 Tax=Streptomyces sp. NPDC046931 TaxID=3154806 RepID=UPI0033E7B909